ncbi:ABC transporter permease [Phytoactinopolyspora mesophila]|uniref:ABC transporter permease n=1 Tax=Phytoactinopolyspora mesophila TaxID=2650750 RepID=A0A7K3M8P2_9ACTN|nr:ABC transporter permease [Phytoactinopolyspora mesophila]NDL59675.1 ABC transporter permease [Phytoactinopolyspora mesophila]
MTTLLALRGLQEYTRRPLNLVLLVVVPLVFVSLTAGALADFSAALGGSADGGGIEAASAGWAAAILAGIAGFFHVSGSREPDRRLAASGAGTLRVVLARSASALILAAIAAMGALVALAARTGLGDAPRAIGATVLFAFIFLAVGMATGAMVRSEMNGSLLIVFFWIFNVFLSPAMGVDALGLRVLPLHFPSQVVTDVASGHAGALGDLGISLAWAVGGIAVAVAALVATTRPARTGVERRPGAPARLGAGLRYGFREYRRNVVLWVLLIGLPVYFITVSMAVTPDDPTPIELMDGGLRITQVLPMSEIHGAIMVPITVAFLSGLAGLFVVTGSAQGDRRLVLAGYRAREVLAARLGIVTLAALLTTAVTLAVTAFGFSPRDWGAFVLGNVLVALTYGMIGVLIGPLVGRLGGLYVMIMIPFIDGGLAQNPMFDAAPPGWAIGMPAHGAIRVLLDGAFTTTFDQVGGLLLAGAWLIAVAAGATVVFGRLAVPARA